MGQWLVSGPALHREWQTLYVLESRKIYDKTGNTYNILTIEDGVLVQINNGCRLPSNAIPCVLHEQQMQVEILPKYQPSSIHIVPSSFMAYIQDLPHWEGVLLQQLNLCCGIFQFFAVFY